MAREMLVVADETDGFDLRRHVHHTGKRSTHPDRIDLGRAERDFCGIARQFLTGIDRDQVHPHGRLSRSGLPEIRVYRSGPIQDFRPVRRCGARRIEVEPFKVDAACGSASQGKDRKCSIASTHFNLLTADPLWNGPKLKMDPSRTGGSDQ